MAPVWESTYFPPLDQCLDGGVQLLSWESTFAGLSETSFRLKYGQLKRHLIDDDTVKILTQCLTPYPAATSQTKMAFEARTSAINVAPTARGRYNIQQLKEDALWLSKEANIDELSAMRLVVLEWQARPAIQLLHEPSEQDSGLLKFDGKFVNSNFGLETASVARFKLSSAEIMETFKSPRERHLRLLYLYLSERKYLLKTVECIIFQTSYKSITDKNIDQPDTNVLEENRHWVDRLGVSILKAWNLQGTVSKSNRNWFVDVILAMRSRVEALGEASGLLKDEEINEELEIAWRDGQVLELIHIMQTTFTLIQIYPGLTRTDALIHWFRFMSQYRFFEQFDTLFQGINSDYVFAFQANIALLSLAILKTPTALETLEEISPLSGAGIHPVDGSPYLLSPGAIREITEILTDVAAEGICNASLAVFAWGIILQNLRERANFCRETKEFVQSQRMVENYGSVFRSEIDGGESSSPQSRLSTGSDASQQSTYLEEVLESLNHLTQNEDPIQFLVKSAVDQTGSFEIIVNLATGFCSQLGSEYEGEVGIKIRLVLLELVRAAAEHITYEGGLVSAILAILTGSEQYWDMIDRIGKSSGGEPAAVFLNDAFLMERIFQVALSRFPYETLPFLKLCHALATCQVTDENGDSVLKPILDNITSFTCAVPTGVEHRENWDRGDIPHRELLRNFDISPDHMMHGLRQSDKPDPRDTWASDKSFEIPAQTPGLVLMNDKSYIVMWHYQYSGLKYTGLYLQQILAKKDLLKPQSDAYISQTVSEIIGLLTAFLSPRRKNEREDLSSKDINAAQRILEEASDGLDRNQDVVSVIFLIFEDELQKRQTAVDEEQSTELLIQCIRFLHALLTILPSRVWSFLGRSGLLGLDGKESRLSAVVSSQEITSGHYEFLHGCTRLFDALINDTLIHAVARKARGKALTRFGDQTVNVTGVSDTVMKKILLCLERIMIDVLETSYCWRFVSQEQSWEITTSICSSLNNLLNSCFEVDDNPDLTTKLTGLLAPAVDYLLDVFLSRSINDLPIKPLLNIFHEGPILPGADMSSRLALRWRSRTIIALELSNTLIWVNRLLKHPPSHLEERLFKSSAVLVKLYAAHESYRKPTINLLHSLVQSIGSQEQQPQSLLGCLGSNTAKHFLELLSILDGPLTDKDLPLSVWRFLSAVVSQRQQWFSIYLLTGTTPREALRDRDQPYYSSSQHIRPMLRVAIEGLSQLEKLPPEEAIAILDFIISASDFWPWVLTELQKECTLLSVLSNYLAHLDTPAANANAKPLHLDPSQIQIASSITTLFAMYIHVCNEKSEYTFAKKLQPSLRYLIHHAVATPSYNASLHGNLQKNFERKFSGCKLSNFKRTPLARSNLGKDYYYNVEIAGMLLNYDLAWVGKGNQGFAEEFSRANINISVVEAQINLLHSWKSLVTEMTAALGEDDNFLESLALVIRSSLTANTEIQPSDAIFTKNEQSRADLAFALMQRLFEVDQSNIKARSILKPAWNTLRGHTPNIGAALVGLDAEYNRILLKILYIALQAHASGPSESKERDEDKASMLSASESTQIVLEIINVVVIQGFRSMIKTLHEDFSPVLPMDFALITAIIRAAFCVPGVDRHLDQLVSQFSDNNTTRYATTLLSWSDQLTVNNDPVYGELSVMFLVELSVVPALAESLAIEGVLSQISSARLMQYFRRPEAIGPFDEPTRMHSIWSRGILPLLLNLLTAVGAPIAGEVAAFLNSYQQQMARATKNFEIKSSSTTYITLGLASEIQSLTLLSTILETYREAGASAGIVSQEIVQLKWDRDQAKEDLYSWLQRRKVLRESIVTTEEREEVWARQKPLRGGSDGAENRLEEKVVEEMNAALSILSMNDVSG